MKFKATLFRVPGAGGWTLALVPAKHAPPVTHQWGRTPVHASVDGVTWETSVWRDKKHGCLLPVPKKIRGDKGDGDVVSVELRARGSLEVQGPVKTSSTKPRKRGLPT